MPRIAILSALFIFLFSGISYSGEPYLDEHVWPISGTVEPDGPLSSTFGPRLKASEGFRYDFHRGIDIPVSYGSPVHAVAKGVVRLAGDYSLYSDRVVQIRHYKPGGGFYYSNYLHLSEVSVEEGKQVEMGEIIGKSGASESGFSHLHFEIRDEGVYQRNCIHPLFVLPYADTFQAEIQIDWVDLEVPTQPMAQVTVTLPRTFEQDDLDLNRVEVSVYEKTKRRIRLVDQHAYDMMEWNFLYTPQDNPTLYLDNPDFNGVSVAPAPFNSSSDRYEIRFTFYDLVGVSNPDKILLKITAEDIWGNFSDVQYSPRSLKKKSSSQGSRR